MEVKLHLITLTPAFSLKERELNVALLLTHSIIDETFFVSEVLEGSINFASNITSESYWRLEEVWLQQVKTLRAYLLWTTAKTIFKDQDIRSG